ncbi:MAG: hypothetical protein DRQ35_05815, partial [Gammaproteobacteria bacterium]
MGLEATTTLPDGVYEGIDYKPEASWLEVNTAAFKRESPVANFVNQYSNTMPVPSPLELDAYQRGEFKPLDAIKGTKFENSPLQSYYTGLKSQAQVEYQMAQHEAEISTTETMGDGFFRPLVGTVMGALASPTTALGAGIAYKLPATMVGRAFAAAGINMGLSAVDEFLLQQVQDTRTAGESAMVIGLGGVLGGGIGAIGRSPVKEVVRQTASYTDSSAKAGGAAKVLTDISQAQLDEIQADVNLTPAEKTVKIHDTMGENYKLANEKAMKIASFGGLLYKIMPDTYMFANKSNVMRRVANKWLNNPLMTEGNVKFKGDTPLDVRAARIDEMIDYGVHTANDNGYANLKKAGGTMSKEQFDKEFQKAIAENGEHAIPEVAAAAKEFDEISKRVGREAVKEKILLGDEAGNPLAPLGDKNWFLRTWSSEYALRTDEIDYATRLADLHTEQLKVHADAEAQKLAASDEPTVADKKAELNSTIIPKLKAKLKADSKGKTQTEILKLKTKHKAELVKLRKEAAKEQKTPAQKKYAKALTKSGRTAVVDRYRGMHRQVRGGDGMEAGGSAMRVGFDGQIAPEPGRTVDIPTSALMDEFLEGDAVMGATRALKRLNRQVLMKQDERFGDDMMGNIKEELYEEFAAKRSVLDAKGKSTKKLAAEHTKNLTYINNMLREYYGIRPPAANEMLKETAQWLKLGSVMTKLGGVMMSTLPEMAAGLNSVGVRGYMRHVAGWASSSKDMRAMTKSQRSDYSLALDSTMAMRIAEMGEYESGMSSALRNAHKVTDITLDKAFGLGVWTRMVTAQAGVMIQSKIGRLMFKTTLSNRDKVDLARMGISEDMITHVQAQVRLHGKKISGGSVDMQIGKWTDESTAKRVLD